MSWALSFREHSEALALDFTTADGRVVTLRGRATAWPDSERVLVEGVASAGALSIWDVAEALASAVRCRLVGSDELRGYVGCGYTVVRTGQGEQ